MFSLIAEPAVTKVVPFSVFDQPKKLYSSSVSVGSVAGSAVTSATAAGAVPCVVWYVTLYFCV